MDVRVLACVMAATILAGCFTATPTSDETESTGPPGAPAGADAVTLVAPTFRSPVLVGPAGRGAEPSIVTTPEDHVYVAAAPRLWRSTDGGASFEPVGAPACAGTLPGGECAPGQSYADPGLDGFTGDVDLAVDAQGVLYHAGLFGASGPVPFQASRDGAASWTAPIDLADGNASDRQWIDARADGTVLVTWRDFGAPGDSDARDRLLYRSSHDGGAHWNPARVIADDALQGPIVHDPTSRAAYTVFYDDGIRVARSADDGRTWAITAVTSEDRDLTLRSGRPIDLFPVIAVDDAGNVYVAWSADTPELAPAGAKDLSVPRVLFAASTDEGASWTTPRAISPEGRAAVFPWLVAGQPGRVAVAWYENRHGLPNENAPDLWDVALVESVTADTPDPRFVGGYANREPVHLGAICTNGGGCDNFCTDAGCAQTRYCATYACAGKDRSRVDFFEMALRPDGHPLVAWVADADPQSPESGTRVFVGGVERGTRIG